MSFGLLFGAGSKAYILVEAQSKSTYSPHGSREQGEEEEG